MKRCLIVLLLVASTTGCSSSTTTPTTLGVDGAPQLIKNVFLSVSREAATLADYEATNESLIEFARAVCSAGLETVQDRDDFVADWAGPKADQDVVQMWSTAAHAATSSFCPLGQA